MLQKWKKLKHVPSDVMHWEGKIREITDYT